MQEQSSVFGGAATSLALRYTGKPVSGWGGLVAVMRYLERRGVRRVLESVRCPMVAPHPTRFRWWTWCWRFLRRC
jgi:hypothetical protein